jgi:hypothetical protein
MSNANKKPPNIFDLTVVDIVGLDSESHGRSCTQHLCCGHSVKENDVLFCTWQIQLIENSTLGEPEEVVQVYKIAEDGLAYCHVGYLPKRLFRKYGPKQFDKMFLRVLKDYRISDNSHERSRSHHFYGMALGKIIRDDLRFLGKNPLNGDRCLMLQKANTPDNESTTTETTASLCKPVEVSTVCNRRKAITVLPPKIPPPAYESQPQVLTSKAPTPEDDLPITNFVYFSKISEFADRAEVSNCRQFGTPDSKRKHTKRGLSTSSSSLDSSFGEESTVDEDEIPIEELVYSSPRKSTRKKKPYSY